MKTILIPTTQNIELEYPVASAGDRILGFLIDLLVLIGYYLIADFLTFNLDLWGNAVAVIISLPAALYSLITETYLNGQTLGKLVMKTKVIRIDGSPATIGDYLIRWMLRFVDIWLSSVIGGLIGGIGLVAMLVNKQGQRLGDMAAGTTVVKLKLVTTFEDTMFMETLEDHQIKFPQIQSLSDRDVAILKEVLDAGVKSNNPQLLLKLSDKVKEVAGIKSEVPPRTFLELVLKDYNHIYSRE